MTTFDSMKSLFPCTIIRIICHTTGLILLNRLGKKSICIQLLFLLLHVRRNDASEWLEPTLPGFEFRKKWRYCHLQDGAVPSHDRLTLGGYLKYYRGSDFFIYKTERMRSSHIVYTWYKNKIECKLILWNVWNLFAPRANCREHVNHSERTL